MKNNKYQNSENNNQDSNFSRDIKSSEREPERMVFWQLNDKCNYRCEYCFCGDEKLSKEHPECGKHSPEHIAQSFTNTGKTWQVHMSGGEPFLYPDYVSLCRKLTKEHYISINTNLPTNNVKQFAEEVDPNKVVFINAGFHVEQREKMKDGIDSFIEKVILLQDKGFNIDVGYLGYVPLFERMEKDMEQLRTSGIKLVNAKTFRGYYEGRSYPKSYSEKERDLLSKHFIDPREEGVVGEKVNYFGRLCGAGERYFRMDPAGNLFRCSTSYKGYGNLFSGKYNFDESPKPCPLTNCGCPYEGFKYVVEGKSSVVEITKEICSEIAGLPARGVTLRKVVRYLGRRRK